MVSASAVNKIPLNGNAETTSQKKVAANRRNAQLSTGPTSAEGKKTSSHNALKHGLLVKDVVITRRSKENQAEFDALLAELRDCYMPRDLAEDLLVRELAISYWKSGRALRYERGELTCADATPNESELSEMEITLLGLEPAADAYHSQLRSSRGIKFLLRKIDEAQDEVRVRGSLSAESRRWLAPEKNWKRISGTQQLLAALEKETKQLTAKKVEVEENESQWRNDQRDCSAIPSKDALDRSDRYETKNVRHRYKVEARLDQLLARPSKKTKSNSGVYSDATGRQDAQFCQTKPTGSSGEPQVTEARAAIATLEVQVAQAESGVPPEVDPIGSPINEAVATAESDVLLAAEETPCPTEADTPNCTDGGERAESRSDERDKVAQEERGVPLEVDRIGSPTNETLVTAESDVLLGAEQTPCPTDARTHGWTDGGDGAETRSDKPDEAGEA